MSENSPLQRTLVRTSAVLIGVFVCLLVLFCSGLAETKYNSPSNSARSAKWRGVYLRHVELSPIEPVAKNGFSPKEAWLESIYENSMTVPFVRTKTEGIRLCVRFEYSPDGPMRKRTMLHDLEMTINGKKPKGIGGSSDRAGFTFEFYPDPNAISPVSGGVFPEEGELTFGEKPTHVESKFHYSIK